ncbi:Hsp20/alpha crystallin family protein [Amycolatopsis taiwanensis]|uniref:Alpha-crystallin n=1 Tax=Amycolatopsis taiwanensis TaxID=342230 RepID=A0A9W6R1E0_9PSEU|nr:Hsp20/alpha crystallin family protein [Amycolatopsis taiwanensis]GLY67789.1 alpha-crystallin [Amycolatopsis taiwanensis]
MPSLMRRPKGVLPGIADLLEGALGEHPVRIEESMDDGTYVVRAELPGLDPENQIKVTTQEGLLTISAERSSESSESGRSEFRYGSFTRTVSLPQGADPSKITAKYADGILEVKVPVREGGAGNPVHIDVSRD